MAKETISKSNAARERRLAAFRAAYEEVRTGKWGMADILLQEFPYRDGEFGNRLLNISSVGDATGKKMALFAKDAGVPLGMSSLISYRITAYKWPNNRRNPDATFSTHMKLNGQGDRFLLIKEVKNSVHAQDIVRHRDLSRNEQKVATDAVKNIERAARYIKSATHSAAVSPAGRMHEIDIALGKLSEVFAELVDVIDAIES